MSLATLIGIIASLLVGFGLYGLIVQAEPLRKILSFNVLGSGVFLFFGVIAQRGSVGDFGPDPVPQAMVITGIVVAFAATALATTLVLRLFETSGKTSLEEDPDSPSS